MQRTMRGDLMSDVVEQLRREAKSFRDNGVGSGWLEDAAADEIERLRVTIDDLCHKLNDSEHVISEMLRITTEHKDAGQ